MPKNLNDLDAAKLVHLAEIAADLRRSGAIAVRIELTDAKYCSDMIMLAVIVASKRRAEQMLRETMAAAEAKGIHVLGTAEQHAAHDADETHRVLSFYSATDPLAAPEAA